MTGYSVADLDPVARNEAQPHCEPATTRILLQPRPWPIPFRLGGRRYFAIDVNGDWSGPATLVAQPTRYATVFDTLTVTPARAIAVPEAGDVLLSGVLRSELQQYLNTQMARFVRNAVVRAEPLMRFAVIGEVRTPGFVHVPAHALLSDVLSAAGGPTPNGSLDRVSIRRDGRTLVSTGNVSRALTKGVTLDELDLRAGDEVVVEAKRAFNWTQMLQTTAIVVGSAATFIALKHR